jgi:multidrug efflux pump subunit AcrB
MLVVLIFLRSIRKTFIIGVSIPLAIMATFVMMGIQRPDAQHHVARRARARHRPPARQRDRDAREHLPSAQVDGLDPVEGAHVGAAEVTSAVVASTSTNLASVAPFLLITGLAALIFRELILTISFAILASLPLALTLVPMLAAQLGKVRFTSGLERNRPLVAFDDWFNA